MAEEPGQKAEEQEAEEQEAEKLMQLTSPIQLMGVFDKKKLQVRHLNATSEECFMFQSGTLAIKVAVINEDLRALPHFIDNGRFPKLTISRRQFDREKAIQQQVYAVLEPFTQVCPQVYQAMVFHPSSREKILNSLTSTEKDTANKMLTYLRTHLTKDDSIGIIVMELLSEPYMQLSQYIDVSPAPTNFLEIALQVGARMVMVYEHAGVWNPDTHLGNIMIHKSDRTGKSVMLIDYGRGQLYEDYEGYHQDPDKTYYPLQLEHFKCKEDKRFSKKYERLPMTTIDAESVFRALQSGLCVEYSVRWGEFQCILLLREWFPFVRNRGLFMDVKPSVQLFTREWFGRDHPDCTRRLTRMADIIRELTQSKPLNKKEKHQHDKDVEELRAAAQPLEELRAAQPLKKLRAAQPLEGSVETELPSKSRDGGKIRKGGNPSWKPRRWYSIPPTLDVDYNATTKQFIIKNPVASIYKKTRRKKWTKRKRRKSTTFPPGRILYT
jgi:hypothetical protein